MFDLDPRLAEDCHFVTRWPVSQVLLMDDQRYPWLILVPTRNQVSEIFELSPSDQQGLWREISVLSAFMKTRFQAHKINVGALGNVVTQLHIHVVARYTHDATFPNPVWGVGQTRRYPQQEREAIIDSLSAGLVSLDLTAPTPH